jgi:hypothetical protein
MKAETDLDLIFSQKFEKIYSEIETRAKDKLNEKTGKKLYAKRNEIADEILRRDCSLSNKYNSATSSFADAYTTDLLRLYSDRIGDYEGGKISIFITDQLECLKNKYKQETHALPQNIKLNSVKTVELIAEHRALELFLKKINRISQSDDLDIILKKIRHDENSHLSNTDETDEEYYHFEINDTKQIEAIKREFTTARQVLAVLFLLKQFDTSTPKCKKNELAHFIQFLTGKNLGSNTIENTNIYKRIKNPLNSRELDSKKDLQYIKKLFLKLELHEIVTTIEKAIDD